MNFTWQICGHKLQKKELENNLIKNNLAQAYLFSGPEHVGKFSLAKEFSLALLCPNNMCRTCSLCRQIENLTCLDFIVLDKLYIDKVVTDLGEITKFSNVDQSHRIKSGIKTNTITVDDIRNIQKKLQEKPLEKYKICLIKDIDRLNIEATNAFLKNVEEPHAKTVFIFTTAKESQLLSTFLSRLRIIRFNLVPNEIIKEQISNNSLEKEILELAQGRVGTAIFLSRFPEKIREIREIYDEIKNIYESKDVFKQFAFAEKLSKNTEELKQFLEYSFFYLRSKIKEQDFKVATIINKLNQVQTLIEKNVNKRLVLENFFLELNDFNI